MMNQLNFPSRTPTNVVSYSLQKSRIMRSKILKQDDSKFAKSLHKSKKLFFIEFLDDFR